MVSPPRLASISPKAMLGRYGAPKARAAATACLSSRARPKVSKMMKSEPFSRRAAMVWRGRHRLGVGQGPPEACRPRPDGTGHQELVPATSRPACARRADLYRFFRHE
jgi:hypothetical protein